MRKKGKIIIIALCIIAVVIGVYLWWKGPFYPIPEAPARSYQEIVSEMAVREPEMTCIDLSGLDLYGASYTRLLIGSRSRFAKADGYRVLGTIMIDGNEYSLFTWGRHLPNWKVTEGEEYRGVLIEQYEKENLVTTTYQYREYYYVITISSLEGSLPDRDVIKSLENDLVKEMLHRALAEE